MPKCSHSDPDIDGARDSGLIRLLLIKMHESLLKSSGEHNSKFREAAAGKLLFVYLFTCLLILFILGVLKRRLFFSSFFS